MCRKLKQDNRGIALVSVMVGVMLCLLLSATIMRISYLSYLQKSIGEKTTAAFYTNETFVDDLKMGIQKAVAKAAIGVSSSSTNASVEFIESVKSILHADSDLGDILQGFVEENDEAYDITVTVEGIADGELYVIENDGADLVIKNVLISYKKKPSGYISKVITDIRIRAPFYTKENTGNKPLSLSYSMIAGSGALVVASAYESNWQNWGTNQWGNFEQQGDVYVGYDWANADTYPQGYSVSTGDDPQTDGASTTPAELKDIDGKKRVEKITIDWAPALNIDRRMSYHLSGKKIIINGDVYISNRSNWILYCPSATDDEKQEVEVRGTIYIDNNNSHLILSEYTHLTCKAIKINGSNYTINTGTTSTNHLPIRTRTAGNESDRKTWDNASSSIAYYAGGKTKNATASQVTNHVTFNANAHPVANIYYKDNKWTEITKFDESAQVDSVLAHIVDVAYMESKFGPTNMWTKEPKAFIKDAYLEDDAAAGNGKKKVTINVSNLGNSQSSGYCDVLGTETLTSSNVPQSIVSLGSKKVLVNVGFSNIQVANDGFGYFMIKWGEAEQFGQLNSSTGSCGFYGMYLCKSRCNFAASGNELVIGSSIYDYFDQTVPDGEEKSQLQKVLDLIGRGIMWTSGGASDCNNTMINNMFHGGIASLYSSKESSSGNTGNKTVSDTTRNSSFETITFENWTMDYRKES